MDRFDLEREYRLVEDEYNKAKATAAGFRGEYKRKCDICIGYVGLAVIMVMFYYLTIIFPSNYGPPIIAPIIIVMRFVYWAIGAIYVIFLLKKIYNVYLEGYSPRARKLAERSKRIPLTQKAEKYDEEASKYENRLNEIQELMLENEMK